MSGPPLPAASSVSLGLKASDESFPRAASSFASRLALAGIATPNSQTWPPEVETASVLPSGLIASFVISVVGPASFMTSVGSLGLSTFQR